MGYIKQADRKLFTLEVLPKTNDLNILLDGKTRIGRVLYIFKDDRLVVMNNGKKRPATSVAKAHRVIEEITSHRSKFLEGRRTYAAERHKNKEAKIKASAVVKARERREAENIRVAKALTLTPFEDCSPASDTFLDAHWASRRPPMNKPVGAAHYSMSGDANAIYSTGVTK